jgi:hypothetical protein
MIGCGDVTEIKSGPGFYKADHSRLIAVMRRNGQLARTMRDGIGIPRWHVTMPTRSSTIRDRRGLSRR